MIDVRNLSFAYTDTKILDDLSFSADPGQLIAVLGPNGAGKSTLFRCLLGLYRNYDGKVLIDDKEIRSLSRKQMAANMAYIPQSEIPAFNYTVIDTVLMGTTGMLSALQSPGPEQIGIAREALADLGILHMENRGINEISGGERQLAFLARAMAQKAKILIMDEPTANLDYGNQQIVMQSVSRLAENGYTILMSTHNPEHALQYASHVLALKDHKIYAYGKAGEVLSEELINNIYGLEVKIIEVETPNGMLRSCVPAGRVKVKEQSQ